MKNIARIVVAATALASIAGTASAPAIAAPREDVQMRNVWCC